MSLKHNSNFKSVAMTGSIGLLLGLGYGCAHILFNKYMVPEQTLIPITEQLYKDKVLLELFVDLQNYKHLDENSFTKSVNSCDRLLYLYTQLSNKHIQPKISDRMLGYVHYKTTIDNLKNLYSLSKQEDAKIEITLQNIYNEIVIKLKGYWQGILNITTDIPL